ncbi:MAG: WD40 repeat domain-containing serine/threonine-protein kinase [Verrucomicrobiota bacterium]
MSAPACPHCGTPLAGEKPCFKCLLDTGIGQERQPVAERIFRVALSYEEAERTDFIRQAAGADTALENEVRMLLEGYAEAGGDAAEATMGGAVNARALWAAARREEPGTVIDHFRLVRLVGEGGMGAVWEAEQMSPIRRRVALKIIKLGMDTEEVVRRFERERRTLALMTHPHIAQVFEVGATPLGRPYFAMELVAGDSIIPYCRGKNAGLRERLTLFLEVCAAVEHAHQKGVIHRDLKPSNILIADGAVKVIDFGIAKATLEEGGDGLRTRQAQVLGTPAYMSPEQAESDGQDVDTRTDVWSLGVVLYELLSGALPFDPQRLSGTGMREMRRILREESPPRPSTRVASGTAPASAPLALPVLRRELRGDLDWIVMKALSKERARRYAGAAAFGEDVRRFLRGRPVGAVPPAWSYYAGKFVRRHLPLVTAAALVMLALAAGLIVSLIQTRRTAEALAGEADARREATFAVSDLYARSGLAAAEKGEGSRAALWFTHAARIAADDPARVTANRLRAATWTAASTVPVAAFETGMPHIEHIDFHPGGRAVILTRNDGEGARVWNLETEKPFPPVPGGVDGAAWDTSGTRIAITAGSRVRVLEYPSGRELAAREAGPGAQVAFSPDGETLAVGAAPSFLWSWKTGEARPMAELSGGLKRIRWSADGRLILLRDMGQVGVLSAEHPERPLFEPLPNGPATLADFIGTTRRFFHTPPEEDSSLIRDGGTGEVVEDLPGGGGHVLAAASDGHVLARSNAPLWDTERHAARSTPATEPSTFITADFDRHGQWLATGSDNATVRLWSVAEDRETGPVGWHQAPVQCVAFSPDSEFLATSQTGLVRIWKLREPPLSRTVPVGGPSLAALTADGQFFAASGLSKCWLNLPNTRVFHTGSGEPAGPELNGGGAITEAAFSPDGSWLAVTCATTPDRAAPAWNGQPGSGFLQLWNWRTGERLGGPVALPSEPRALAVHPSGDSVAVYCGGSEMVEQDLKTGILRPLFSGGTVSQAQHTLNNGRCAWTPDGRYLLAWGQLGAWRIWDRQAGREIPLPPLWKTMIVHDLAQHGGIAALAPIGGPEASMVRLVDIASGREISPPLPHSDWIYAASFDESGRWLLTTGRRPAQVWDWRAGRPIGPALPLEPEVMAGIFMPGTPWVITGGQDGMIRFWDPLSGMPVRPPIPCNGTVGQLLITPNGKTLLAAGYLGEGEIRLIDLPRVLPSPPEPGTAPDPEEEQLAAEINAAATVHKGGGLVPLTAPAWLEKWRALRANHPARARW